MNDGSRGLELLSLVHRSPGITRADAARALGIGSGYATEITAQLVAGGLIDERPAAPSGTRGRPSTVLNANPRGPLALCVAVDHESWRVAVIEIGSRIVDSRTGDHDRDPVQMLTAVRRAGTALRRTFGSRICASAVSVPGTVSGDRLLQASGLGWSDVDLSALRSRRSSAPFIVGNDATFAAVAEARRGAGVGYGSMLHLYFDAGLGGALIEDGRAVMGATGVAGEFGHLPFGDPRLPCPCGAYGCWNLAIDASAIALLLGRRAPRSQVGFLLDVLNRARRGDARALGAVEVVAAEIGRGTAGLVNGLDPAVVTFGGHGGALLELAEPSLRAAYLEGLMSFRRGTAPQLLPGALGIEAPIIGAAEECFDAVLTPAVLAAWTG